MVTTCNQTNRCNLSKYMYYKRHIDEIPRVATTYAIKQAGEILASTTKGMEME